MIASMPSPELVTPPSADKIVGGAGGNGAITLTGSTDGSVSGTDSERPLPSSGRLVIHIANEFGNDSSTVPVAR
jgi:hypothetical protein